VKIPIPNKQLFKLGEVCDITGIQAHVLRYWESEFPMLAPQKNRAGQRTYRKRDVEMVLRIKELLYEDQYTIAGAKKKMLAEFRSGKAIKILIADADTNVSSVILDYMERSGKEVIVVQNGKEALRKIRDTMPDVVILETNLPEIDGMAVCRQIKIDEKTKNIPSSVSVTFSKKSPCQSECGCLRS
jgi:CheY-like chemotaxis protein